MEDENDTTASKREDEPAPESPEGAHPAVIPAYLETTIDAVPGFRGWSVPAQKTGASESSGRLTPGAVLGDRYEILEELGEGGMGAVYKARDRELDRVVAMKVIRPELAGRSNVLKRFKQELILAREVTHKNVLRIFDLGDAGGMKFITMAYVEGKDLHAAIAQDGRLPAARAVSIARQIAAALEAAHAQGVVHRDLKPRNVLVDQDDQVYVSDFGLAKSLESTSATAMTRTGEVMGTPRYMSPEQAEAKPLDHRSDIYSFGIVLYEMVTGDVPFSGDSALQVMYQHVSRKPKNPKELNPEVPEYLARIILRCLEKDPAERYQSAHEILSDLESEHAAGRPGVRYSQWAWGVLGAGVVALAVALALLNRPVRQTYVAVLPFRVLGDQPELRYVAEGVADSLSAKLFQLKNVYVASAADAETAAKQPSLQKIANTLGVRMLVQGSVQGDGDKASVVVSLDDGRTGRRVWSQQFPVFRRDLLASEDHIYNKLADALELKRTNEDMARSAVRPTEDIAAYDLYLRGRNLLRGVRDEKNVTAAVDLYNQATQKDPKFALAYAGLADACIYMYDLKKDGVWAEKALGAAQQADRYNDALPEVHFALGTAYTQMGKTGQAIAELERALTLAPNSDDAYRRMGNAYLKAGGHEQEAIQAFEKAVKVNPYFWHNHNQLGGAYFQVGKNEKALEEFREVTKLEPDRAAGYANIGAVYFQQGKWSECIPAFDKANKLQPSFRAYSNIGVADFYLGRYADAANMFEKAVALNPNEAFVVGNLADAYRQLGQREKAMATYDRAIALEYKAFQVDPRDSAALGELGLYYAKKGEIKRGLDFIARARAIDPKDNDLMYSEAVIYALAGRQPEALRSLREALEGGYSIKQAENDPDLKSLQSNPEFQKLLKKPGSNPG